MSELNEKVLSQLANSLQIEPEKLTTALTSKDVESLDIKVKYFLTDEEKSTLEKNIEREKYNLGKKAGEEMLYKEFKKSKKVDIEANNFDELFDKLNEKHKSELDASFDEKNKSLLKKLEDERNKLTELQKTFQSKESEFNTKLTEMQSSFNKQKVKDLMARSLSTLTYEIPANIEKAGNDEISKYLDSKHLQTLLLFESQFDVQFDEDGKQWIVDKSSNSKLVDSLQNPAKLEDVVKDFAVKNYITLSDQKKNGRGAGNSNPNTSFKGMSLEDLIIYAEKQGIKPNTTEFDGLYREWKIKK